MQSTQINTQFTVLNTTIWHNKNTDIDDKSRIYKTATRPIMIYTAETRTETTETKRLMESTERKILRGIAGKTLLDGLRRNSKNRSR